MRKPIQISIPNPCQEDWNKMTSVDKGRFCDSCQKNVIDFSRSPDREIAAAFAKDDNLCGRFLDTQLGRDLILPAERSRWWITASAAVLSVMAGTSEMAAQTSAPVEQYKGKVRHNPGQQDEISINGNVSDEAGPFPGAFVINKSLTNGAVADIEGNFTITTKIGDTLEVGYSGYESQRIVIHDDKPVKVNLVATPIRQSIDVYRKISPKKFVGTYTVISRDMIVDRTEKKRTFFGRIFHGIGNLFH